MDKDILKRAIDLTRDSLKENFHIEEVILPYEPKDGEFYFFISTYKFFDNVKRKLKEEFGENTNQEIYETIKNQLREQISEEEKKEVVKILERKLDESRSIGRTKGMYKTTIDFLMDESEDGFKEWEKKYAPNLRECAKGFWIIDDCCSEPKCGNCGDYLFIEKKKDEKDRDANHEIMNLEQAGLIIHAAEYILEEDIVDRSKKNKFGRFWAKTQGKIFRDTLEKELRMKHGEEDILKEWIIYKNFIDFIDEFSIAD